MADNPVLAAAKIIMEQLPKFAQQMNVPFTEDSPRSVMSKEDPGLIEKRLLETILKAAVLAIPVTKGISKVPSSLPVGTTLVTGDPTNLIPGKLGLVSGGISDAEAALRLKLPSTNYMRPIKSEVDTLYREMNGENFLDLFSGNFPFGPPRYYFAETPDMALGQGANTGLRIAVKPSDEMRGKINLSKPGLDQAYLTGMGEFIVEAQPTDIAKNIVDILITPEAYKGLSKGMATRLDNTLKQLESSGVFVTREGLK